MIGINDSSIQYFNEKDQLCKSGVRFLFLVVEFDTYQQIFLKALLVETSSILTFDENIQFCK